MSADSWSDCPQCGEESGVREYKGISMQYKLVEASYDGECLECGFKVSFSYEHPFEVNMEIKAKARTKQREERRIQNENKPRIAKLQEKIVYLKGDIIDLEGTP